MGFLLYFYLQTEKKFKNTKSSNVSRSNKNTDVNEVNQRLQKEISDRKNLVQRIDTLSDEYQQDLNKVESDLQNSLKQINTEINSLKSTLATQKTESNNNKTEINSLKTTLDDQKTAIDENTNEINIIRDNVNTNNKNLVERLTQAENDIKNIVDSTKPPQPTNQEQPANQITE